MLLTCLGISIVKSQTIQQELTGLSHTECAQPGCGLTIGQVECELWLLIVNDLQVQYKSELNNSIFEIVQFMASFAASQK